MGPLISHPGKLANCIAGNVEGKELGRRCPCVRGALVGEHSTSFAVLELLTPILRAMSCLGVPCSMRHGAVGVPHPKNEHLHNSAIPEGSASDRITVVSQQHRHARAWARVSFQMLSFRSPARLLLRSSSPGYRALSPAWLPSSSCSAPPHRLFQAGLLGAQHVPHRLRPGVLVVPIERREDLAERAGIERHHSRRTCQAHLAFVT